ncbi:MAG: outer membrane protein assembly factor BamD [Gammaproteobacteria bacterium]|nr:outer membrane protein assembly factor BamD [Gammaproteobacteria bacterium]MCP5415747.1 outer membrane protein assembly factor BamD [Chromatiaceae bacterium]
MKIIRILLVSATLLLSACSLLPEQIDETKDWSAQKFYKEASESMAAGDYQKAIEYYETLEARYPFGQYAIQSQIDVAYAYYKDGKAVEAIAAADRFIKLHPRNPHVDYAYYLKGLVNFNRNLGFIQRFIPTDTSQRDPVTTLSSFNDFAELVRLYPDSEYSADARQRMVYLRNNLAMNEMHVARYYMKRGAYLAAANRCVTVIEKYQRTPSVKEALEILALAYDKLGMQELSADARRVLAINQASGALEIPETEVEESYGRKIWNYLELDKN